MNGKVVGCFISGSCSLPSGEILLVDNYNSILIKLDSRYKITNTLNLQLKSSYVCHIRDTEVVVSTQRDKSLYFVDTIHDMRLIRTVDIDQVCHALACHGDTIYVGDGYRSVYAYNTYGVRQFLYTNPNIIFSTALVLRNSIAVSDDGSKLYISANGKLVTIDKTGKELFTLNHTDIRETSAVCLDNQGHVFVSSRNKTILQISADGKRIVGVIYLKDYFPCKALRTMVFHRKNVALVLAGISDSITIFKLELK